MTFARRACSPFSSCRWRRRRALASLAIRGAFSYGRCDSAILLYGAWAGRTVAQPSLPTLASRCPSGLQFLPGVSVTSTTCRPGQCGHYKARDAVPRSGALSFTGLDACERSDAVTYVRYSVRCRHSQIVLRHEESGPNPS